MFIRRDGGENTWIRSSRAMISMSISGLADRFDVSIVNAVRGPGQIALKRCVPSDSQNTKAASGENAASGFDSFPR
jgi:hypothetical protein